MEDLQTHSKPTYLFPYVSFFSNFTFIFYSVLRVQCYFMILLTIITHIWPYIILIILNYFQNLQIIYFSSNFQMRRPLKRHHVLY